jgi:hypothetical protein
MKKFIFWLLVILSLVLSYRIGRILIYDFSRLTEYGFGYLIGLIILFLVMVGLAVLLGYRIFRKNRMTNG